MSNIHSKTETVKSEHRGCLSWGFGATLKADEIGEEVAPICLGLVNPGNPRESAVSIRYTLDQTVVNRSPGCDDGPVGSLASFLEEDPFEGVGSQRMIDLGSPGPLYPDIYALDGGVDEKEDLREGAEVPGESQEKQYLREFNRAMACGKRAAVMSTDDFEDYLHRLDCRKSWCPVCGGKGGKVHKARVKSIRRRVDLDRVNLRHVVLTVPEGERWRFHSYEGLNQLANAGNRTLKKHFGKEVGMVCGIHLYGDRDKAKWNPHLDVMIVEEKGVRLKLSGEGLQAVKDTWRRSLTGMGCVDVSENVFYQYRMKPAHKGHCVKYVVRPTWDGETLREVDDEEKKFLVLDLKGFRHVRYWGSLSHVKYHREGLANTIEEAKEEGEALIGKKLHFRAIVHFNVDLLTEKGVIEKIADGFYRIVKNRLTRERALVEGLTAIADRSVGNAAGVQSGIHRPVATELKHEL